MNPIVFLISFSPWILFGMISGNSLESLEFALIISLVLSIIVGYKDMKDKLLVPWITVAYFVICVLLVAILHVYAFIPFIGITSNAVLTLIAVGSVLIGMPFTEQYARREVPKEKWGNEVFRKINRNLTLAWALLFFVGLAGSILETFYPDCIPGPSWVLMWVTIIIGIVVTLKYPQYYKDRIKAKAEQSA